jgi:hypothetical protein
MIQNTQGQPSLWVIPPMSGVNSTIAKYWAELKMAAARPRSDTGNQAATIRLLAGNDGASAAPSSRRSPNKEPIAARVAPKKPTNPWATVKNDQVRMLQR